MTAAQPVELLLAPVDVARRSIFRALGPLARRLVRDRALRVSVFGVAAVAISLGATLFVPLWLMAVGPIVIGVPHLLADVRYLVLRPGLHRRVVFWLAIGLPLALGYALTSTRLGMVAVGGALLMARTTLWRRLIGLVIWGAVYAAMVSFGQTADLAVLQLHNLLTLGIWWAWRPRNLLREGWVLVAFMIASLAILGGAVEPVVRWSHGFSAPGSGLTLHLLARTVVPLAEPLFATRLVLFYGFAQAVHYMIWVRVIPEDDRPRATPRSFVASWRALRTDFGSWGLAVAVAGALGMAVWAAIDLIDARAGYVKAALFHFDLEFAIVALCLVERHRPGQRAEA